MKIAVLALTHEGQRLARHITSLLPGNADLYIKEGYEVEGREQVFSSLSHLVRDLFSDYDGLIFVMATGIVVRVIAPLIQHKSVDPAVVVIDEKGQFAISLLSGHLGGANLLATQLADLMGATPVITTATDVQGLPAIDMVAKKLGLRIDSFKQLKFINSAIVNHGTVDIYSDIDRPGLLRRCPELEISTIAIKPIAEYTVQQITADVVVLISDRVLEQASVPTLVLRPQTLSIGIGCRRGTSEQEILNAIQRSCEEAQRSPNAIRGLHTAWVKFDEDGLLQAGKSLQVPVVCYSQAQLQKTIDQYEIPTSQYVMEQIGVGAVCEPAAILGTRQGNLILPKRSYNGITVAIAEDSYPWWGSAPAI